MSDTQKPPEMAIAGAQTATYKVDQAIMADYRNTGFDKGHLNPFFYQCDSGRTATFTLTNCVPQNPCFNEQIWKDAETQSKKIMNELCSYSCAKRHFVTGAVPTIKKIPNEIHDKETDVRRDYNRTSVPSHIWTAACCDTTACTDPDEQKQGFSYSYIGNNTADPYFRISTVRVLEQKLIQLYKSDHHVIFSGEIFTDDKCKISDEKSNKAQDMMKVPLARKMTNEVRTMSFSDVSSLPLKKRKLIDEGQLTFKIAKLMDNVVLSNAHYGMNLSVDEAGTTRQKLLSNGLTLMKVYSAGYPSQPSHFTRDELKRSADESVHSEDWAVYDVVRKQYKNTNIAFDGTLCRPGHNCGKHDESYLWCYTDWSDNWQYCCEDDCDFGEEGYTYCTTAGNSWNYCSQTSSMIPIKSERRCLQDHQCGLYGETYYWCYVDLNKNWDYCCQPWDLCRDRKDGYKKWCYTGREKEKSWQYCT